VKIPLQITIRDLPHSESVEAAIREKAEKLEQFYDQIMGCRVMVESPHRHRHKGKLYHVRIDLTVPGNEIVVKRNPPEHSSHEDIYVAIRDAFNAAQRRLQDYVRRRRGEIKNHVVLNLATVFKVFPAEGYGFLKTADGREIYFHRNSLVDMDFDHLDPGTEVHYVEEQGEEGSQAATVTGGRQRPEG